MALHIIHQRRGVDHEDERRALMTAFNGDLDDFVAREIRVITDATGFQRTSKSRELVYVIDGSGALDVIYGGRFDPYTMEIGTRVVVPPNHDYRLRGFDNAALLLCSEQPSAPDEATNGPVIYSGDFEAKQVKIAKMHIDAVLGGHWHDYNELFFMLKGEGEFEQQVVNSQEISQHPIKQGERLLVPARSAHRATIKQGAILIGCTEQPYVSPDVNDHRYEFR